MLIDDMRRMGGARRPHRSPRSGVRRVRAPFGAGAAAGDDTRHRRAERHGDGGRGRRGGGLRAGRDLAAWLGLVPAADDHRRQGPARRHHQARQRLPAHAAHPRRPGGAAGAQPQRDAARGLAAGPVARAHPTSSWWRWRQSSPGSPGRCCAAAPTTTAAPAQRRSARNGRRRRAAQGESAGGGSRWPDSRTASWKPGSKYGAATP